MGASDQPNHPATTSDPGNTPDDPYLSSYRLGDQYREASTGPDEFGLRDLAARVGDLAATTRANLDAALRTEALRKREVELLERINAQLGVLVSHYGIKPLLPNRGEGGAGAPRSRDI